ncbi:hypothetical protein ACQBAU_00465 [Propionibacteriaceae bacterium Y2011]
MSECSCLTVLDTVVVTGNCFAVRVWPHPTGQFDWREPEVELRQLAGS